MDAFWKPVDDRHPADGELVVAKCANGSMFVGFCIYPYADSGEIKNWYIQTSPTDWYRVNSKVVSYYELPKEETPQ